MAVKKIWGTLGYKCRNPPAKPLTHVEFPFCSATDWCGVAKMPCHTWSKMGTAGQKPEEGRENERGGEKGAVKRDGGNWAALA